LFISNLALDGSMLNAAKIGIIIASAISALAGIVLLLKFLSRAEFEPDSIT